MLPEETVRAELVEVPDIPLVLVPATMMDAAVIVGYPIGRQSQYICPEVKELICREAPVLAVESTVIPTILGLTNEAELSEGEVLTWVLVMALPTSPWLHELRKGVTLTLRGGKGTLNRGSLSKQRYITGVVRLWTMG